MDENMNQPAEVAAPTGVPAGVPVAPAAQPMQPAAPTGVNPVGTAEGINGPMPAELHGWNWGAFLWSWIWGVAHNVWLSLLVFVPVANVIMPFVLGAKGNEWAWQHRRFESVDQFRAVQRAWTRWGVGLLIATIVLYVIFIVMTIVLVGNAPETTDYINLSEPTSLEQSTDFSVDGTQPEDASTTEAQ